MADNVREEEEGGEDADGGGGGIIREQDRLLPIANVGRLMKRILPPNAKISKDAKETMQESVSEFVSFVTGEASEKCRRERRKTLNGDDVCCAVSSLGFDSYVLALRRYLARYRDLEGGSALESARSVEDGLLPPQRCPPVTGVARGSDDVSVSGQIMSFSDVIEMGSSSNPYSQ